MLVTQQTVLRRFWYPVMPMAALADGPRAFTLLGAEIVLWLDAEGNPAAAIDRCCHRSARLSRGRCQGGLLQCGYHGWTFDRTGRTVRIPQRQDGDLAANTRIGIAAYHAAARYGYAWVCLGQPLAGIPDLPEADDTGFRCIDEFYETWDAPGLRIMENSFDNAHFSYVHQSTFGVAEDPVPAPFTIEPNETGFVMLSEVPVKNRELQQRNLKIAEAATVRRYEKIWYMPFSRRMKITYPNGLQHVIFTAATPIDDRRSQVVQFAFRNDTEADAPARDVIAFDRQVTMEDRAIVELCDPDVPLSLRGGEEFHMGADGPGLEMRRQIKALLDAHGEAERRGPPPVIPPASVTWRDAAPEAAD